MARYYGDLKGQANSAATRLGSKKSGLSGHIRGLNTGVSVSCRYDEDTGEDIITCYITGGSNGAMSSKKAFVLKGKEIVSFLKESHVKEVL